MTPADLAAALGVDVESVKTDAWGDPVCEIDGIRWIIDVSGTPSARSLLRYEDGPREIWITIPITTTLKAAVAHVRAMLAVPEPTP